MTLAARGPSIMVWIVFPPPPNVCFEGLTLSILECDWIWRWSLWNATLNWGHYGVPWSNLIGVLVRKENWTHRERHQGNMCIDERPCEDIARRWPTASQQESPYQKPNHLEPWSWTSSLQNYEEINFCYLSHPVNSILLWQPDQTHITVVEKQNLDNSFWNLKQNL